jgi:hypothetical protein
MIHDHTACQIIFRSVCVFVIAVDELIPNSMNIRVFRNTSTKKYSSVDDVRIGYLYNCKTKLDNEIQEEVSYCSRDHHIIFLSVCMKQF